MTWTPKTHTYECCNIELLQDGVTDIVRKALADTPPEFYGVDNGVTIKVKVWRVDRFGEPLVYRATAKPCAGDINLTYNEVPA